MCSKFQVNKAIKWDDTRKTITSHSFCCTQTFEFKKRNVRGRYRNNIPVFKVDQRTMLEKNNRSISQLEKGDFKLKLDVFLNFGVVSADIGTQFCSALQVTCLVLRISHFSRVIKETRSCWTKSTLDRKAE